jgi:RNA polymerase sigma-70 factor (ECF subfamily)
VYTWVMRLVRNRATAEDLTIETFWRAYRAHARFDAKRGRCAGWLRRIATNAALDYLRSAKRELPLEDEAMEDGKSEKPAERAELRRKIHAAINQLSPKLRVATILALIEEESYAEIAESLGISVNAVKVRVFRGVRVLRKELEKEGIRP